MKSTDILSIELAKIYDFLRGKIFHIGLITKFKHTLNASEKVMSTTISHIINLAVKKIVQESLQGKGKYISFRIGKLSEQILKESKTTFSRTVVQAIIKYVLDSLCLKLNCEKTDTSRGVLYRFERSQILSLGESELVKMCIEAMTTSQ